MSANKPAADDKKAVTIDLSDPDSLAGTLKAIGGSRSDHWNSIIVNQTFQTLWVKHSDKETRERQCKATASALVGIGPKDESRE